MTGRQIRRFGIAAALFLHGCASRAPSPTPSKKTEPPAHVTAPKKEAELTSVVLTRDAVRRLGIETASVENRTIANERRILGDLVLPPGKSLVVTAPVSGTVTPAGTTPCEAGMIVRSNQPLFRLIPLVPPQRDLRVTYEAELTAASARTEAARLQLERATQLLRDQAGSRRALEQSQQEFAQAKAASDAAALRLERLKQHPMDADLDVTLSAPIGGIVRQVFAGFGQQVTAGAPLAEVADTSRLWIRVPVYAGDLDSIAAVPTVTVTTLGISERKRSRLARKIPAPPSADPLAVTVDLFYEIANPDGDLRPGQKIEVTLPLRSATSGVVTAASSILYDSQGGTWVYVQTSERTYVRERVELARLAGKYAILAHGPTPGAQVVVAGAAELFGTEFGAGK